MANESADPDQEDFQIGWAKNGAVMIVTIPFKKWAEDKNYGDVLVSGVFTKAERIALKQIQVMRAQQAQNGIVKAPGGLMPA